MAGFWKSMTYHLVFFLFSKNIGTNDMIKQKKGPGVGPYELG
jgi:hypothetical protein